jgi:hypothetical protein
MSLHLLLKHLHYNKAGFGFTMRLALIFSLSLSRGFAFATPFREDLRDGNYNDAKLEHLDASKSCRKKYIFKLL